MARLGRFFQQIPFAAEIRVKRRHQLFEIRIERRIGHLREKLPEIVVQKLRLVAQTRQRRIGAHRAQALPARSPPSASG